MAMMTRKMRSVHERPKTPRKRKLEEDREVKRQKEFESWEDLEDLMKARIPRGNC